MRIEEGRAGIRGYRDTLRHRSGFRWRTVWDARLRSWRPCRVLLMPDTQQTRAASRPVVRVFAPPPASGCAVGKTWKDAAEVIFRRLADRFGIQVAFEFIELFSPEFFQFPQVMARLQEGSAQVPIIAVDGEIVQSGGKISERAIREVLEARGLTVIPTE